MDQAVAWCFGQAQPGDAVLSIAAKGQGSEGMWIMSQGHVRMTYQRTGNSGFKTRTVESDLPCNQGCAGGPLVNQRGELVGVMDSFEQNARLALKLASFGYVLETGRIRLSGEAAALAADNSIVEAYLGVAA